jgi:N-acetylmuramic acid 6-phosphate etherase
VKNFTEQRNPASMNLDQMSIAEILELMNDQDRQIPQAIYQALPDIKQLIEAVVASFNSGGRLIYIGAGTSGRLGILDAAECVPTFGTPPEMVVGLIAGGEQAIQEAVEGAEDSKELAEEGLKALNLNDKDVVVGIAASGRTPYVMGGLEYAQKMGAQTGAISNNENTKISAAADYPIEVITGPEVLTGSTRLKAGTSQKLVLNMISTISMVKIGKAYENLMVDVQATNEKLVDRSKRIIVEATGVAYDEAESVFDEAQSVKLAIVMILADVSKEKAEQALAEKEGLVREAIQKLTL